MIYKLPQGIVIPKEPKKEAILLAMGKTRLNCPYDVETWTLNNGYRQMVICHVCEYEKQKAVYFHATKDGLICPECGVKTPKPRIDKILLAHNQCWDAAGDAIFNWDDFNVLAERGVEIINTHRVKGLKAKRYPMKQIVQKFGVNYFSDTIAYQVALALYRGYNKIRIHGADMASYSEYATEKGGIEFWIGLAMGLGVEVELGEGSTLLLTATRHPYGAIIKTRYFTVDEKGVKTEFKPLRNPVAFSGLTKGLEHITTPNG